MVKVNQSSGDIAGRPLREHSAHSQQTAGLDKELGR
jgi:hypothetical protein